MGNLKNNTIAYPGMVYPFEADGEVWSLSWHSPPSPPDGIRHGSAGLCLTAHGEVILISQDGKSWDFPGGKPEGTETWEETLRRELMEEACVEVLSVTLLGFARAECTQGKELGRAIVRSFWRAEVEVHPWEPQFETTHRLLVQPEETLNYTFWGYAPIYRRVLQEAGLLCRA